MSIEEKYFKEYGKQVQKYLETFGLIEEDLAKLTGTTSVNIKKIINGEVGLNIKKMINIASAFGIPYYHFANPKSLIPSLEQLPKATRVKIVEREKKGIIIRDNENKFSIKLDELILKGNLNKPNTSKLLLKLMESEFENKISTEVTALLSNSPRNEKIKTLKHKYRNQSIYINKDYFNEYCTLSKEKLAEIILAEEIKLGLDKK